MRYAARVVMFEDDGVAGADLLVRIDERLRALNLKPRAASRKTGRGPAGVALGLAHGFLEPTGDALMIGVEALTVG